jgi:serine/threonine protein kinase
MVAMDDPTRDDPFLGRRLGRDGFLRVDRRLTAGGMGAVYLARDEKRDRPVVVKFLHSELFSDASTVERFKREGRRFGDLRHPHLIRVYGLGREQDAFFLLTEYVRGRNLRQLVEAEAAFSTDEALRIGREVALGLAAAHAIGVIHRDLKPDNIMLRESDRSVVVLDFGIAKDLHASTALTMPGTYVGTVGYSAPEQLLGQDVDARTDVFALGVILYELLTGRMAFDGKRTVEIEEATLRGRPTPIVRLNEEVVGPLARLIERMIERKPRRRPRDMEQVALELERIRAALAAGEIPEEHRSLRTVIARVFGQ